MSTQITKQISPWVIGIVSFFILLAVAQSFLVYQAFHTNNGVIVDNPYEKALLYQETLDSLQRASTLGWSANYRFPFDQVANGSLIELQLLDSSGSALSEANVEISAFYPADGSLDFGALLRENQAEPGVYLSQQKLPKSGLWLFTVRVTHQDNEGTLQTREIVSFENSMPN